MKNILLTITFFLGSLLMNADFIDYWDVYYNKVKIKEFNQYNKTKIKIKTKDYNIGDQIIVRHFDDTPCQDCLIFLFVETDKKRIEVKTIGEGNPLKISVKDLLALNKNKNSIIKVYYSGIHSGKKSTKKLLFEIEII